MGGNFRTFRTQDGIQLPSGAATVGYFFTAHQNTARGEWRVIGVSSRRPCGTVIGRPVLKSVGSRLKRGSGDAKNTSGRHLCAESAKRSAGSFPMGFPGLAQEHGGLRTIADGEFVEDLRHVVLDGLLGEEQPDRPNWVGSRYRRTPTCARTALTGGHEFDSVSARGKSE